MCTPELRRQLGGEPSEEEIREAVAVHPIEPRDLLYLHVVRTIADRLRRHDRVLLVYGDGHHIMQERALAAMLGDPRTLGRR